MLVLAAAYDDVDAAEADYEAIKALYFDVRTSHDFDAAVIDRDENGKVRVVKHEQPTRHGAAAGMGWGLAVGAACVLLPGIGLVGLAGGAAAGATIGAVTGHVKGGMSNDDLRSLGEAPEQRPGLADRRLRHEHGRPGRRRQGAEHANLAGDRRRRRRAGERTKAAEASRSAGKRSREWRTGPSTVRSQTGTSLVTQCHRTAPRTSCSSSSTTRGSATRAPSRRPDRYAELHAHRRRRPEVQPVPRHRALLADAGGAADRPQQPRGRLRIDR